MLEKFFAVVWFLFASYDVLETFIFPKFLGDENSKIDQKFSKELANDFLELKEISSVKFAQKTMLLITVVSAIVPLIGFILAYTYGNFSGLYEKFLYLVTILAVVDFSFSARSALKLAKGFGLNTDPNKLANDLLKANNKNVSLHIVSSAGIFVISFKLILELFINR